MYRDKSGELQVLNIEQELKCAYSNYTEGMHYVFSRSVICSKFLREM